MAGNYRGVFFVSPCCHIIKSDATGKEKVMQKVGHSGERLAWSVQLSERGIKRQACVVLDFFF